jgi:phage shock protein PspC (stress-responsive transcriptional regulator)
MTSPTLPPAPKKLARSRSNRVLGGVCAGIANYLNMDPTLVRVLTVVLSLFTGVPIAIYLVLLFVIPEEEESPQQSVSPPATGGYGQTLPPTGQPAADPVWGSAGAPWEQPTATQPASSDQGQATPPPARPAQPTTPEAESTAPEDRPDGNPLR